MHWRHNRGKKNEQGGRSKNMIENNAFRLDTLRLRCLSPILISSIAAVCSGPFYHSLPAQDKKHLKAELGLCFEIETAKYAGSIIFIAYSMLIYSEKWPWKPHPYYC